MLRDLLKWSDGGIIIPSLVRRCPLILIQGAEYFSNTVSVSPSTPGNTVSVD